MCVATDQRAPLIRLNCKLTFFNLFDQPCAHTDACLQTGGNSGHLVVDVYICSYSCTYRERAESHCINKHHSRSVNVWRNTICHHPAPPLSEKDVERKGKGGRMEGSVSLNGV